MPDVLSMQNDGLLTRIAVDYKNKQFIADQVLPPIPVDKKTGRFKKYSQAEEFLIDDALIGPNSAANEIDETVTEDTFATDDYGLVQYVNQEVIDNAVAPLEPMSRATVKVMRHILRRRERRVAQAILNTNNYAAGNQIDIAGAWATLSTDIWGQLLTGIDACAAPPNVMVLDVASFRAIQRNQTILAAIKGTLAPQFIEQIKGPSKTGSDPMPESVLCPALALALGLDKVLIGAAQFATSVKGQTLTKGRIWDLPNATKGGAALLRVTQDGVEDVIWGAQMQWKPPQVMRWFTPERGAYGSTAIKVVETSTVKLIANDAGYLFRDTLVT